MVARFGILRFTLALCLLGNGASFALAKKPGKKKPETQATKGSISPKLKSKPKPLRRTGRASKKPVSAPGAAKIKHGKAAKKKYGRSAKRKYGKSAIGKHGKAVKGRASFTWLVLQTLLILAAVCLLAYLLLRWGMRRFQGGPAGAGSALKVLDRLPLEPRRALYVVEVGNRILLLGTSEQQTTLLAELDEETAQLLRAEWSAPAAGRKSFREVLSEKMGIGKGKS